MASSWEVRLTRLSKDTDLLLLFPAVPRRFLALVATSRDVSSAIPPIKSQNAISSHSALSAGMDLALDICVVGGESN